MPITSTLEPLLEGDDSVRLREALSQAAWIVLVGTADRFLLECMRGVSAPVLVVEPDQELMEQRAEAAAALGLKGIVFLEQVVGATGKDVSWYRYNDARLNGLEPLAALKPRYPNLALESIEVRQQLSLAQLLQAWEPALVDGGVLVLPEQAGSDWLDGASSCLQRLRALCWEWPESLSTPSQQHIHAVLADSWLVPEMLENISRPELKTWRRDPALHVQANLLIEHDRLLNQAAVLDEELKVLAAERDVVLAEREELRNKVIILESEMNVLKAERDVALAEREELQSQVIMFESEMNALKAERGVVLAEREELRNQVIILESEMNVLKAERGVVLAEREELRNQVIMFESEMNVLKAERDVVIAEREELKNQVIMLEGEKAVINRDVDEILFMIDRFLLIR